MDIFSSIGFGLVTASILIMPAIALVIQIKLNHFFNLAHGDIMALSAFLVYFLTQSMGLSVLIATIIILPIGGLINIGILKFVLRPLEKKMPGNTSMWLISSIGLAFIIRNIILLIWGPNPVQYPHSIEKSMDLILFDFTPTQIGVIIIAIISTYVLWLIFYKTKIGRELRAITNNRKLAELMGVNTIRAENIAWFISGIFGTIGGVLIGVSTNLSPSMGAEILLILFVAITVGGIENPFVGVGLGTILVGISMETSSFLGFSEYKLVVIFSLMVLVLIFKPKGLISK